MTDTFIRTWRVEHHPRRPWHAMTSQETLGQRMESATSAVGGGAAASNVLSAMNALFTQPKHESATTASYSFASSATDTAESTNETSTDVDAFVGFAPAATDSVPFTSESATSSLGTTSNARMGSILATVQLKSKRPATKKSTTSTKHATTHAFTASATATSTATATATATATLIVSLTDPYIPPLPTIESLASNSSGSNNLSKSAIVGIAAASTIGALIIAAGLILFFKRRTALATHRQRALKFNEPPVPKLAHSATSSEATASPETVLVHLDPRVHKNDAAHSDFMYPTHESLDQDSMYATLSRTKRVAFSDPVVTYRNTSCSSDEGSLPEYDSLRSVSPLIPISEVCVRVDPVSYVPGRRASLIVSESAYEDPYDYSRPDLQLPMIQTLDRYYESSLYSEPRHT
ncbi:hypothetical protein BJ741DRAFT_245770 [Chytriomyces cf. hyalinus JEL632]|nr:hypothetical protein BJ741DRAFT_245770 [Chytriomyces cf. hyalinus JEL632]